MTAARSDLMALDREAFIAAHKHLDLTEDKDGWGRPKFAHDMVQALWDGWHKDRSALRLAASQPDREAVKEFIASASFASRSSLDSDTIFCEIYTPGYQPAKKGSFGFFVKELRAILSLLSGAGTKSDGVEGHADPQGSGPDVKPAPIADSSEAGRGERVLPGETHIYGAGKGGMPHAALSAPVGEPVAWQFMASDDVVLSTTADKRVVKQWEQSGYHVRPLYTHPPAPAVGPDVRRRVLDILNVVAPAVENLAGHQEQCDMDGVMVKVSRQALDEVLNAVNEVALVSALQSVEGGVQVAAKQESCPESAPRTEMAGAIYSALSSACIEHSALSVSGFNLFGDSKSIKAAQEWLHSHSQIGDLKTNLRHWRDECGKLHAKLTKTPSADHDAGNLRGLAEPTSRDSSESTTGGAAPDHTTMEERGR